MTRFDMGECTVLVISVLHVSASLAQYTDILLMHSRITATTPPTLVVLRFSFAFSFPGLRREFDCCALVLCTEVAQVLEKMKMKQTAGKEAGCLYLAPQVAEDWER